MQGVPGLSRTLVDPLGGVGGVPMGLASPLLSGLGEPQPLRGVDARLIEFRVRDSVAVEIAVTTARSIRKELGQDPIEPCLIVSRPVDGVVELGPLVVQTAMVRVELGQGGRRAAQSFSGVIQVRHADGHRQDREGLIADRAHLTNVELCTQVGGTGLNPCVFQGQFGVGVPLTGLLEFAIDGGHTSDDLIVLRHEGGQGRSTIGERIERPAEVAQGSAVG